jgi:hypothetical protein
MPTITNIRPDSDIRSSLRFNVFTDGDKPRDIMTEWFDKNNIGSLKFKCRAWNSVARAGTKISEAQIAPVIAKEFGLRLEDFTLKFSVYAGCSCGCSPGYVGKLVSPITYHPKLSRANVWMKDIPLSDADKAAYDAVCQKQDAKLKQEIYNHDHAAEIAAAAEAKRQEDAAKAELARNESASLSSSSL